MVADTRGGCEGPLSRSGSCVDSGHVYGNYYEGSARVCG